MKRLLLISSALAVFLHATSASAGLCAQCQSKRYIMSVGACSECSGRTTSSGHRLCRACSAKLKQCEHCRAEIDKPIRPQKGSLKPPPATQGPVFTEVHDGKTQKVAFASIFHVKLKIDPIHRWMPPAVSGGAVTTAATEKHLPLLGPDGKPSPTSARSGHVLYTFKAVRLGTSELLFLRSGGGGLGATPPKRVQIPVLVVRVPLPTSRPSGGPDTAKLAAERMKRLLLDRGLFWLQMRYRGERVSPHLPSLTITGRRKPSRLPPIHPTNRTIADYVDDAGLRSLLHAMVKVGILAHARPMGEPAARLRVPHYEITITGGSRRAPFTLTYCLLIDADGLKQLQQLRTSVTGRTAQALTAIYIRCKQLLHKPVERP